MPGYKGHLWGGLASGVVVVGLLGIPSVSVVKYAEWFACALAGSLFPDVDISSKGQKLFYRGMFFVALLLFARGQYYPLSLCSLGLFAPLMSKHRGLFHRFWFIAAGVIFLIGVTEYTQPALTGLVILDGLFFLAGVYSHLLLDFGIKRIWVRRWR